MRVLKSAKWVSCLAASGGLMLMLGGNAMAADSDSAVKIEGDQKAAVSVSQEQTTVSSSQTVVTVSQTNQAVQATGPAAESVGEVPAPVKPVKTPVAATPAVASPLVSKETGVINELEAQPSTLSASAPEKVPAAPVAAPNHRDLPLQSMGIISFHPMPVSETVAQLPTAAAPTAPTKAPSPAEPTGALGQLSAQLAGTVIKPVFVPEAANLGLGSNLTLTIFLMILTVRVAAAAFGFATRRDGYAHAARSDVAGTSNLIFATPFSMSYVTATRQRATHF